MAAKIELHAQTRQETGKRASRRLRRTDKVIGTLYGAQKAPTAITVEHHKLLKAMENEAFYSTILTLTLDTTPEKVVVKALQRHPSKPRVQHVDFFRINPNEKLTMHVPLHFLGEDQAPGVKVGNGVISHFMNEVGVRCLPSDLPEYIEIDLSKLEMNDAIHLSDLKLPKGVELVDFMHGNIEEHNKMVANLHAPHIIQEPIPTEAPVATEVEAIRVSAEKPEEAAAEGKKEGKKE